MSLAPLQKLLGSPQLATAVTLLLLATLATELAALTWQLTPPAQLPLTPMPTTPTARTDSVVIEQPKGELLASFHLFGEVPKDRPPPPPPPPPRSTQQAPQRTALNLELRGVLAGISPTAGHAIIATKGRRGEEGTYSVGETLEGGAVLEEVYPDRVTLRVRNRMETLPLDDRDDSGVSLEEEEEETSSQRDDLGQPLRPVRSDDSAAKLRELREQIAEEPANFARMVRPVPARVGGKFVGYRLFPRRNSKLMEMMGLKPGDIVTEINGESLNSPSKAVRLISELNTTDTVDLVVKRGQEELPVRLDLRQ